MPPKTYFEELSYALRRRELLPRPLEEDGLLRVDCADPESDPGTGLETTLWFQPDSHQLIRGELSRDGFRAIRCDFSVFAKT